MGALVFVPPRLVIEVTEQRTSNGWAASAYDEPIILPPSDVNLQETSILQQPAVLVDAGMAVGDTVTQKDMATRHQTRIDPLKDFGVTGADLLGSLGKPAQHSQTPNHPGGLSRACGRRKPVLLGVVGRRGDDVPHGLEREHAVVARHSAWEQRKGKKGRKPARPPEEGS